MNKLQNSDAEDVIKAEMQEYQPGETVNTAFELTELPVEKTLPSAMASIIISSLFLPTQRSLLRLRLMPISMQLLLSSSTTSRMASMVLLL